MQIKEDQRSTAGLNSRTGSLPQLNEKASFLPPFVQPLSAAESSLPVPVRNCPTGQPPRLSYPCEDAAPLLMVVADRQHQRDEAAQHQSQDLHLAQPVAPAASGWSVAVASAPDLGEDVHGGHVEEGPGGKEHGHAGGVDVRQRLFAALRGGRKEGGGDWGLLLQQQAATSSLT